jgi:hypothetical protein
MLEIFAKVTPTLPNGTPFRLTAASAFRSDAVRWWEEACAGDTQKQDILIVYVDDFNQQDAVDLMHWVREYHPILMDVMAALETDGTRWGMWSVENNHVRLKTPINDDDIKFLKGLRIKLDDETANQSGLHLV